LKGTAVIQNLLPLLPRRIGAAGVAAAIALLILGCGLWLLGARFSRPLLTLASALGGGAIGFQFPHWFGWSIDPMAMAILGSLLLGTFGYLVHNVLAAAGLGMAIAFWAALAAVAWMGLGSHWAWPAAAARHAHVAYLPLLYHSLPPRLGLTLAAAVGVGLLGGWTIAYLWPRVGVVLFWSLSGVAAATAGAMIAARAAGPRTLEQFIPNRPGAQAMAWVGLVALGAGLQWRIAFFKKKPPASKPAAAAHAQKADV
jgi:hypothetical protein